jgi:hypothetical protein
MSIRNVILFLLLCGQVAAGTYWVSPTGAAAWGSAQSVTPLSGTACASVDTAEANAVAGDVVYLRGGTYDTELAPANSGATNNPITFAAHTGETPVFSNGSVAYATYYYGLRLLAKSWIKVQGITFQRDDDATVLKTRLMEFTAGSSYNEVADCIFDGRYQFVIVRIWDGGSAPHPTGDPCVHNWLHGCTFKNIGELFASGDGVDDSGGVYLGVPTYDATSDHTTIEGCTFYGGGHHNLETYTRYNVIRSNFFHFEGMITNATVNPADFGPDYNGLYGNRNIQIYDGYSSDGMFNLLEKNRFGASGPPPDDDGGDGMTITAPKNIIRYNAVYSSFNNGILFKLGGGSYSYTNRFFNNTIWQSGRYQNTNNLGGDYWQGANIRWYRSSTNFPTGNTVKNNIMFGYGGAAQMDYGGTYSNTVHTLNAISDNWLQANGDPLFSSTVTNDFTSATAPNLYLQSSSGAIDGATHLTLTSGDGTGNTLLAVDDALYFQDGSWGSVLAGHQADWIAIGSVTNVVQIASVDYALNTITLTEARSWGDNDPVWIYKDAGGSVVLVGSAPDLGAYEYSGAQDGTSIMRVGGAVRAGSVKRR